MATWARIDNEYVWTTPDASTPTVDKSDNDVVAVLLGPKGNVISHLLEREPIGFKPGRWK